MKETKIAVITGASGSLGHALAQEMNQSWTVIGTGRSARPKNLASEVQYYQFDASESGACEAFWKQIKKEYPTAQICLINNAGGYVSARFAELTFEDYEKQMISSYFSSVYMTKALTHEYAKAKIINIVSASALKAHKKGSAYGSAKAAQMYFFQALQEELDAKKYQITNLYPNNITAELTEDAMTTADLAAFIREQAENERTYYLRDVSVYAR